MKITKTLNAKNRLEWRKWLSENYDKEKEIWLLIPRKSSGKNRIPYNDTVEEALCYGWIDSIQKPVDKNYTAQRFSPRNRGIPYSQTNIERLRELVKQNKVIGSVIENLGDTLTKKFLFPEDILKKIKSNRKAWNNYQRFSQPYKRIRIAYIESARNRPEEFEKRLDNFIKKTEAGKTFGYGGVEKYF